MSRTPAVNANDPAARAREDAPVGRPCPARGLAETFLQRSVSLRRIVAGMGFAPADADDILQDVYLEASRAAGRIEEAHDGYRWLVRVTVNRCLLEYRRRKRFVRSGPQILEHRPDTPVVRPDEQAVRAEQLEAVRRAMHDLEESLAVPLALRYFSGMNASEIGEVLDLPASTVRSRLREARMILARRLTAEGFES